MGRRELALDVLLPICAVIALAAMLLLVTGTWPPLVAVESGSMEPNVVRGDLIILTAPERVAGTGTDEWGIVTAGAASEAGGVDAAPAESAYSRLGGPGDVIVFQPPGRTGSPILHRVAFAVEADENWYDRADDRFHSADDCAELANCPAPHAGYITIGDDNARYDQADDIAPPVKPEWIQGKAQLRVPLVGWLRLGVDAAVDAVFAVTTQALSGVSPFVSEPGIMNPITPRG